MEGDNFFTNNSQIPDSDFYLQFKKFNPAEDQDNFTQNFKAVQHRPIPSASVPKANPQNFEKYDQISLKGPNSSLFGGCNISPIKKVTKIPIQRPRFEPIPRPVPNQRRQSLVLPLNLDQVREQNRPTKFSVLPYNVDDVMRKKHTRALPSIINRHVDISQMLRTPLVTRSKEAQKIKLPIHQPVPLESAFKMPFLPPMSSLPKTVSKPIPTQSNQISFEKEKSASTLDIDLSGFQPLNVSDRIYSPEASDRPNLALTKSPVIHSASVEPHSVSEAPSASRSENKISSQQPPLDSSVDPTPPIKQIKNSHKVAPIVKCPVCQKSDAQYKLQGIVACRACAKCFVRYFPIYESLVCDDDGREECNIAEHDKHMMCNKCRVLKCITLGMKLKKGAKKR